MLDLYAQNFRNLRDCHLRDNKNISLVIGDNEAGKTSLIGLVQWVLTGEAFGCKGQTTGTLVTYGERAMSGQVQVGKRSFARSVTIGGSSGGDSLKTIAARLGVDPKVLPLMFNAKLNGDGGNTHMKAFLEGIANAKFDAPAHFVSNPEIKSCIDAAVQRGCSTTKQIIAFCIEQRALNQDPPQPALPTCPNPTADMISTAERQRDAAQAAFTAADTQLKDTNEFLIGLGQLVEFFNATEQYKAVASAATTTDPLATLRAPYSRMLEVQQEPLNNLLKLCQEAGCKPAAAAVAAAIQAIVAAQDTIRATLAAQPPPPSVPAVPVMSASAQKVFTELTKANCATLTGAVAVQRETSVYLPIARNQKAAAETALEAAKTALNTLQQQLGAWSSYRDASDNWAASVTTARAAWARWDTAAKDIAAAETDYINKAGMSFGQMVTSFGEAILGGRKLTISRDDGIYLGKDPIDQCSESTKWRMEVAIMTAVGRHLKSPLLLIDGADILDANNIANLIQFLREHAVPYFEHILINRTPRGALAAEYQAAANDQLTVWHLKNGMLEPAPPAPARL